MSNPMQPGSSNAWAHMQNQIGAAHAKIGQLIAQGQANQQILAQYAQQLGLMGTALQNLQMRSTNDPKIQKVESIPGRRIPFDYLVEIPIPAGVESVQTGTITISQEGPFVAVSRVAALRSAFEFQYKAPGSNTTANFRGRSYGRQRPYHSAWDLNDSVRIQQATLAPIAFPGTGAPHVISPSNESGFRSMEGDFTIYVREGGTSYPRMNVPVPSSLWTKQINAPFELGALDVWERGDVIQFEIQPLHANNPQYGNVSGFGVPNANYPFITSQWDSVEGIQDKNLSDADTTDPITRLPNAFLIIGFHGYRIVQPAGAGPY